LSVAFNPLIEGGAKARNRWKEPHCLIIGSGYMILLQGSSSFMILVLGVSERLKQDIKMTEQLEEVLRAGIAIDPWKEAIFRRHLSEGGYTCEEGVRVENVVTLVVMTTDPDELSRIIQMANAECARDKHKYFH
jgi:hypothetical protein